jgi:hypothetical protein
VETTLSILIMHQDLTFFGQKNRNGFFFGPYVPVISFVVTWLVAAQTGKVLSQTNFQTESEVEPDAEELAPQPAAVQNASEVHAAAATFALAGSEQSVPAQESGLTASHHNPCARFSKDSSVARMLCVDGLTAAQQGFVDALNDASPPLNHRLQNANVSQIGFHDTRPWLRASST